MGGKEVISEILKEKRLTASGLVVETGIPLGSVKTYLQRLKKEGVLEEFPKDGREIVYTIKNGNLPVSSDSSKELKKYLKFLNEFFYSNVEFLMTDKKIENFILENEKNFNKITELIK